MSKKLGLAFASAFLPTLGACTALLGSYEVGPGGAVGSDGGGADAAGDVSASESGTDEAGTEAGVDGGQPVLLKCSLGTSNPRTLDTGALSQTLFAFSIGNQQDRVITVKPGQGAFVTTYDRNGGGAAPLIVPLPKVGQILSVRRLASGIGIFSLDTAQPPATGTSIGVTIIDDATGGTNNTTFHLVAPAGRPSGAFALLGSDYLFAYGDGSGNIQAGRFVPGGGVPNLVTVASGLMGGGGDVRSVEIANGKMYIFNDVGPDPSNGNASAGYYVLADTVTAPGSLTTLGSGAAGKASFTISTDSAQGNFQVAVVELDLVNGTPPAVLHAGSVPGAKAGSFNVLDIPSAFTFDTLVDAPFGDHTSARFQASDFIALGPNPNKDPGLEFVWYDTKNKVLRAFNGSAY
jgi:hypothetical protein